MLALQVGEIVLCSGSGAAAKCVGTEYVNMQSTNVSCAQYTCQAPSVCTKQQYQSTAPTLVNALFVSLCPGNGVTTLDYGADRACSKLSACTSKHYEKTPLQWDAGNGALELGGGAVYQREAQLVLAGLGMPYLLSSIIITLIMKQNRHGICWS